MVQPDTGRDAGDRVGPKKTKETLKTTLTDREDSIESSTRRREVKLEAEANRAVVEGNAETLNAF